MQFKKTFFSLLSCTLLVGINNSSADNSNRYLRKLERQLKKNAMSNAKGRKMQQPQPNMQQPQPNIPQPTYQSQYQNPQGGPSNNEVSSATHIPKADEANYYGQQYDINYDNENFNGQNQNRHQERQYNANANRNERQYSYRSNSNGQNGNFVMNYNNNAATDNITGRSVQEYHPHEKDEYDKEMRMVNKNYNTSSRSHPNDQTIGIDLDTFISRFTNIANQMNVSYRLDERPRRNSGVNKDSSVFCLNQKMLCFSAVWNKGGYNMRTLAMVSTGDGTQESGDAVIKNLHAFISTITPGLTSEHRINLIKQMGVLEGNEMGNGFIIKPDGRRIRYEYARSNKTGLVVIANPM
ncbi:hypothetical protein N9A04_00310 [Rickettsiales bacterium]|nr:hypothetical protein [Rickettsiales bacterium]